MNQLYCIVIAVVFSGSIVAMEQLPKEEKRESSELKEIVIVESKLNVAEFAAQLKVPNRFFDQAKEYLKNIEFTSPETYRQLVKLLKENKEEIPWEILKYNTTKKDSTIKLLAQDVVSWRQLAVGGWVATTAFALAMATAALVMVNH